MNKNISNLHLGILDEQRRELLDKLQPFIKGFVLGGGTALALQLNHRRSFDFDFFSSSPVANNHLEKLSQSLTVKSVAVDTADELTFFTDSDIKVTFLYYPFNHTFPLIDIGEGLNLFSVKDIAIKKAYTIGRRGEYRDYFDLYTILKGGYLGLPELTSLTKEVYGGIFSEKNLLSQLVYFDDLLNFEIIPATSSQLPQPEEVKSFFEELVQKTV